MSCLRSLSETISIIWMPEKVDSSGRVMAIDYGRARIGIAISDPLRILARGLETIHWNGREDLKTLDRIAAVVNREAPTVLLVGLPRRTDGEQGQAEDEVRAFAESLKERTGLEPVFRDERYTTVLAHRILNDVNYGEGRKAVIDQVAAEVLLQDYLDEIRSGGSSG